MERLSLKHKGMRDLTPSLFSLDEEHSTTCRCCFKRPAKFTLVAALLFGSIVDGEPFARVLTNTPLCEVCADRVRAAARAETPASDTSSAACKICGATSDVPCDVSEHRAHEHCTDCDICDNDYS